MVKIASLSVALLAALVLTACGSDSTAPREPVTVTAISPASGAQPGGTSVTITGTNFIDVTGVTIGGSALFNRTVVSSTQITGTAPAGANTGTQDVVVTSGSHGSGLCSGCFTYEQAQPGGSRNQITAGWDHTCALTDAGAAYCWGSNTYGTLGNGSRTNSLTAVAVAGGLRFTAIVAGGWHTCALTGSGDAYCWGNNDKGQLGNGPVTSLPTISTVPVAVAGSLKFTSIAATWDHTCGLVASGAAYCWGTNDFGQLGNGTRTVSGVIGSATPVPVSGGLSFTALDAGGYHTCGIVIAGSAYCWGLNESGEIGNGLQGANADAFVPTAVLGGLKFSAIFTGAYHSCALTTDGSAYCWGSNLFGGLGNGSATGPDNCPTYPNTGACSVKPVSVGGGAQYNVLALGGYHSCGLVTDGIAYCWGANANGQVGNGSTLNWYVPAGVLGSANFPSFLLFTSITAASTNYTCGIAKTGAAWCWGRNDVGQLGDGTTFDSLSPVAVSGWPP
jgi:alpha-tubulin suppressor-like RCC1 family protein